MKYIERVHEEIGVTQILRLDDDGVFYAIPADPANTDYQQYLAWIAEGNIPEPWNPERIIKYFYNLLL